MANVTKLIAFILLTLNINVVQALTQVDQATVDAAKAKIVEACPVRWEDHTQRLILPTVAGEDIWEDSADRSAFIAYLAVVLTDMNSTEDANVLADDVGTVAAECATQRTALLDLLLVKEPNDVVLGMRALKKTLETQALANKDGSSQEMASKSCKTIKEAFPDSEDDTYWIDVTYGNTNDAMEVFCDMTTDGGGWTFVAFLQNKRVDDNGGANDMSKFFEQAVGTYQSSRVATSDSYSLGILPEMDDTEMMLSGDSADPATSLQQKRFVRFRYDKAAPAFNFGPMPCTPSGFEFITYGNTFMEGYFENCTDQNWYTRGTGVNNGVYWLVTFYTYANNFVTWPHVHNTGTSSVFNSKTWVYVR